MNPALNNAPAPCQDPNAWQTTTRIRYPYMGEESIFVDVPSLNPAIPSLALGLTRSRTQKVPAGSLGWDTPAEEQYRQTLIRLALDAKNFAKGPKRARDQVKLLGGRALTILQTTIPAFYADDPRLHGQSLAQDYQAVDEFGVTDYVLNRRNELRHDIVDAYREAAQLLWCANYGAAEITSYVGNRELYESTVSPVDPTKLVVGDPTYQPVDFDDNDWNIGEGDLGDLPTLGEAGVDPDDLPDPEESKGGGAGIAIAAGIGIAALFFLTRGRR